MAQAVPTLPKMIDIKNINVSAIFVSGQRIKGPTPKKPKEHVTQKAYFNGVKL